MNIWTRIVALVWLPGDSAVKNPPAAQEAQERQIRSPDQEDPLEEGMATHSSILAWRILWTEDLGGLPSIGSQRAGHDWSNLAYMHRGSNMHSLVCFAFGLVAKLCLTLVFPWAAACQAPLPWDFSGKNNGIGCYFLLQDVFLIQGSIPGPCFTGISCIADGFFTWLSHQGRQMPS